MKISEFERPLEAMQPLLQRKSQEIISFVARELKTEHGVSSMSSAIYDTAWVSLVSRFIEGQPTWTFPESFHYILHAQLPDGGWEAYNTGCDGILNTAAALLALKEHDVNSNYRGCSIDVNLKGRIERASDALQQRLDKWSIDSNLPVGFEILLPAILRLLEEHELRYSFPHCQALMQTEKQKLSKFRPEILYAPMTTTLVHSLEGFIGKVDFDKLGHHVVRGSMMNSPSSTAAYLIHSSTYNLECEDYLKDAIAFGEGLGRGSVPSAFPSTTFEVSWVLATLLEAGFNPGEVDQGHCSTITTYLADELSVGKGITGFSPGVMSDADDTALSIESLLLSGISIDPAEMIKTFGKTSHFITYAHERDPSISANCNILIALLTSENCQIYMDQIAIALNFLIDKWNGRCFADKWVCDCPHVHVTQ